MSANFKNYNAEYKQRLQYNEQQKEMNETFHLQKNRNEEIIALGNRTINGEIRTPIQTYREKAKPNNREHQTNIICAYPE